MGQNSNALSHRISSAPALTAEGVLVKFREAAVLGELRTNIRGGATVERTIIQALERLATGD